MKPMYLAIGLLGLFSFTDVNLKAQKLADNQRPNTGQERYNPEVKLPSTQADSKLTGENIPDYVARWELARVLSYLERYDQALAEYRLLLDNNPKLTAARVEMINVMAWTEDEKHREEALKMVKQIDPDNLQGNKKIELANALASLKLYNQAITIYQERLREKTDDLEVRLRLATTLSWDKQYNKSIKQYEIILQERPGDIQIRRKYAFVLIWANQHEEAAAQLQKTLD